MKRRLFNLAAAVSLVMMLAIVVMWVRSYWGREEIRYAIGQEWVGCGYSGGIISAFWDTGEDVPKGLSAVHYDFVEDWGSPISRRRQFPRTGRQFAIGSSAFRFGSRPSR
jgi:hypothetical protein